MEKRLVIVAKEFNVGLSTVVEHLHKAGFEVESKPTAKITDEMYQELMREFKKSMDIKEQADQLVLGTRTPAKEVPVEKPAEVVVEKPASVPPVEKPGPVEPEVPVAPAETETPAKGDVFRVKHEAKLKVVGKIDLSRKPKPAPKKNEEETPVAPSKEPAPVESPAAEAPTGTPAPAKVEPPTTVADENQLIKAEAPQLKGLKILGKIDASKFGPKKREAKEDPKPVASSDADAKKRKRKRKKIATGDSGGSGGAGGAGGAARGGTGARRRDDQPKEVSKKEIEEKIKATMARLGGGGKKKRQKIRRDKREVLREKAEMRDQVTGEEKLQVTEFISVSELAGLLNVSPTEVITTCFNLGVIVSINQRLDAEIIEFVANEFEHEVEFISAEDQIVEIEEEEDDPADLIPRAPIVTVMGHVDHGKTSLLDYIRSANVVSGEAGGITQHIGAYEVSVGPDDKKITFLDTPGHEAFTAMRARGAKVTDVAVIVIAADDNIMPQTKEAISHAQAAGVPLVFAINKIDKDGANPEKIKEALANMNLLVEEWGGKYQSQDISAKQGLNIDKLLEKILLEAEILDLKANPDRNASGTVLEASLDKGRGYVTKMLVQNGSMEIGDAIVAGEYSGRIKAMFNERGKKVKTAGPSNPVAVLGLTGAPQAGEIFRVMEEESEARQIAAKRAQISREQTNRASKRISLDEIGRRLALGTFKELNLIVKGDFDGSIEALTDALIKLSVETIQINVIHKAVGQIIESDILLASASDAIIIGFQVRPSQTARKLAEKEGVEIKTYSIIYEAIEEIKMAMEGMLEPTKEEKILGQLDVREVYKISKIGTIAGCYVSEGKANRNSRVRIIRDGIVIYPTKEGVVGELGSLKRFKDDIKEVKNGMECGVTVKNFNDIKVGDAIEVYEIVEVKQSLD
ncbi:MAG: translation initiation factor IF-2 [Saprospiraceae bacterium]|nr:translation initiation factor IF-2 [Saprospiraceae bacterium]